MSRDELEQIVFKTLKVVGIAFFLLISGFPFFWMLVLSFRPLDQVIQEPLAMPSVEQVVSLSTYKGVLLPSPEPPPTLNLLGMEIPWNLGTVPGGKFLVQFVANSLGVAVVTVILTLIFSILGAYAVTRLKFRGQGFFNVMILLIYMFPAIVLAIPLFIVFSRLGLRGSLGGLIIVYLAQTLPVSLYMLRSYFQTIPAELEEAGLIDGLTRVGVIRRITLPLAAPAVASVALYVFMIAWNEFLFALLFLLEKPNVWTLSLGVYQLNTQEVPKTWLMAGSVIITVPIIVIFFYAERFLTEGLAAGGVKG